LVPSSFAQNAALEFQSSQILSNTNGCNGAWAGHFHKSPLMDFVGSCIIAWPPAQPSMNTVELNRGNGVFVPVEDTGIDGTSEIVAVGDLNGDGFDDLIVAQVSGNFCEGCIVLTPTIGVQLSNGDGTFKAPVYYNTSTQYQALTKAVVGDFNGDGKLDVAIISIVGSRPDALTIFLNTGSGGLKQVENYLLASSTQSPGGLPTLAAGDLNGDDKTDLAVIYPGTSASAPGKVVPYFATSGGAFRKGGTFSAGISPSSPAIGKFTTSGYGDIAITGTGGITILFGSSSGSFTSKFDAYPYPLNYAASLVLSDFDKDGKLDMAMDGFTSQGPADLALIFWGEGNGSFSGASAYSSSYGSTAAMAVDVNDDGRTDLVMGMGQVNDYYTGSLNILYNEGNRLFRATPNTESGHASGIVAADFNKDGKKDVAVVNTPTCKAPCNGKVTVVLGTGEEYFGGSKSYTIGMHGAAIAAGDLNHDGILDLVVTNATPGDHADTSVLLGVKGGGFEAARNTTLGALSNQSFLVDMNNDGKLDLVEVGGVALGNGDGTFGPLKPFPDGLAYGTWYGRLTTYMGVGDFNGDGIHDVAIAYAVNGAWTIYALIGDGKGNFTATALNDSNYYLFGSVTGLTVGKLTPGGPDDILVAEDNGDSNGVTYGTLVLFVGDGKGNFQESASFTPGAITEGNGGVPIVADFNRDGIPDIAVANADQFAVMLGQGNLNFGGGGSYSINNGGSPGPQQYWATADFNGDGWPDFVFSNDYGVSRLYNVPVPSVSPASLSWTIKAGTKKVTIKNTTTATQALKVQLGNPSDAYFKISANTCAATLKPGVTCTVSVAYAGGQSDATSLNVYTNSALIATVPLNGGQTGP
jgi:hypothetical protein